MATRNQSKAGFDPAQVLYRFLTIGQNLRLIGILCVLGGLAGLILYCYSTPKYYSRSVINWQVFNLPFHDETEVKGTGGGSYSNIWSQLKSQLESDSLLRNTAIRLGVATSSDSMEQIKDTVGKTRFLFRDTRTLLLEIWSADPSIIKNFAPALLDEFHESQAALRKNQRQKASEKYLAELDELKLKIDLGLKERLDFEKKEQLATLTIQQQRLLKLPSELERLKAQMARMSEIRASFNKTSDELDIVGKLSLLSSFDKEKSENERLKTGDVVRRPSATGSSPLAPPLPNKVDVTVVAPQVEQASETWRKLEREKRVVEEQLREQSKQFLPGHESIRKLSARQKELEYLLSEELKLAQEHFDLDFQNLKDHLPELEAQLPDYYATVQKYEQFQKDYALIERGQEDWSLAHNELSKKIAAIQFGDDKSQIELLFSGYELMDDKLPVTPTPKKSLAIGLALALSLGLGVPIGLEFLNSTITRLPQLEQRLGLLGLGMVPWSSPKFLEEIFRSPALGARVPNFLLECFRVIRSNLILHPGRDGKSQVIVVSSARPSEGKSTVAANLAWAFFSMGEKTLLVDCDLRRGRQHELLKLDNELGLSSYFADESRGIGGMIQKTQNINLDVITRGPFMTGASEYLCREGFETLIQQLRSQYDRIVLDGPPVLGLSETLAIQRVTDGVVVVVRAESTKLTDVETCVSQFKRAEATIFGFVLNALDLNKPSNHYYYYYSSPYYYNNYDEEIGSAARPAAA